MTEKNQLDSLREILENIRTFIESESEDFRHISPEAISTYLSEEGIDVSAASDRIMRKIQKMKAKYLLAKANHQRKELISHSFPNTQQISIENIRKLVIDRLNDLTQKQKMVLVHRDLNSISKEDLISLLNDITRLEDNNKNE